MFEENKRIVRRLFEDVLTQGRLEMMPELLSQDYVTYLPFAPEPIRGLAAYKQFISDIQKAFPDGQALIDEQVAEGDKVFTRFTLYGTQRLQFAGMPPANKSVVLSGMVLHKVVNGKLVAGRMELNLLNLFEQLEVLPRAMPALAGA